MFIFPSLKLTTQFSFIYLLYIQMRTSLSRHGKAFSTYYFCMLKLYPYIAMVKIFFSILQFKINVYFPKFEINNALFYYKFKCRFHNLALVKLFQRFIFCMFKLYPYIAMVKIFFSIFQFKFNVYFPKFEINNPILFYVSIIFKFGLHYLAMVKLFQRIIFACLSYIRKLQWLSIFFRFSSLKSMFIFPSLKLTTQYSTIYLNAGFTILPWLSFFNLLF